MIEEQEYLFIPRATLKNSLASDSGVYPSGGYRGKTLSKCSFITYKLRFFDCFCLAYMDVGEGREQDAVALLSSHQGIIQRHPRFI